MKPFNTSVPLVGWVVMATLVTAPDMPTLKSMLPVALNATLDANPLAVGGGWLAIVTVTAFDPVPLALVADTITLEVPLVIGVPEIKPVAVLTDSPAGSPVAAKLAGTLLAVI